jgi:hypothetical protein
LRATSTTLRGTEFGGAGTADAAVVSVTLVVSGVPAPVVVVGDPDGVSSEPQAAAARSSAIAHAWRERIASTSHTCARFGDAPVGVPADD